MLVRLLYASRPAQPQAQTIEAILHECRRHNPNCGITGVLCYGDGIFMQAIEGGRAVINQLYKQIVCDPRHQDVVLLHYQEIDERGYADWTMGEVNMAHVNVSILLKYAEKPVFDPYAGSGQAALALLEELLATASVMART